MEVGRWGGHIFEVSASLIRGFTDLSIECSVETDTKKNGAAQYVTLKEYKPKVQKITAHLRSATGCDVRTEAMAFINEIGKTDYFYIGGKKLCPCQMMLTQAQISNVEMSGLAKWTYADIACTFSQSSKDDGATVSSGSSGSIGSGGSGGTKNKSNNIIDAIKAGIAKAQSKVENVASTKNAVDYISGVVGKAKAATVTKAANSVKIGATVAKLKVLAKK